MLRDAQARKINLIITKDLSRLGRDYIETGFFLEKYFPSNNIRYIAVTDGIDTFSQNGNNDMGPFKSVINDMFAKDISKKVRSVLDNKRSNGQFIGAFAPYGYKKSTENRNRLIIDENTAPIVKRIFDMYIMGNGYSSIADTLNAEGVIPPFAYKARNCNYKNPMAKVMLWNAHTIRSILTNPTYAGNLAQNKYSSVNYKVKKQKKIPKSNWIIVKNTHQPIIDDECFNLVQDMIKNKAVSGKNTTPERHLLSGLLYCGDCGAKMTFAKTSSGNSYAICSTYKRFGRMNLCTRHPVLETELESLIARELRKLANQALKTEELVSAVKNKLKNNNRSCPLSEIKKARLRLSEIRKIIKKLYEDRLRGVIGEQDFIDMSEEYNRERCKLKERLAVLNSKNEIQKSSYNNESLLAAIKNYLSFENLDKAALHKLIDKVTVYRDNKIIISYKFKNPLE